MRATLPVYLISSILSISACASSAVASDTSGTQSTSTSVGSPLATPLTLWDLGFSLRDKWADLREEEACPVPPDLVCIGGGAECGDQGRMEEVASVLHPPEGVQPVQMPEQKNEKEELDVVSFEDWKRQKLEQEEAEEGSDMPVQEPVRSADTNTSNREPSSSPEQPSESKQVNDSKAVNKSNEDGNSTAPAIKRTEAVELPKAPAHNRYNYASPDCSARIHSASKSTQHASSLLHKSRDRYMLTPCKASEHWVVVELCDEIRIEAIEIAVWEFFSGVVREVSVSIGGAEDDGDEPEEGEVRAAANKWEHVGTFIGKNVRGVQTFTLASPTSFQRFIRLDFPSHFGTEYYCPVSQVKVYGMNQMEAFKWEQKRLAATAKDKDRERQLRDKDTEDRKAKQKTELELQRREEVRLEDLKREKELDELEKLVLQQARRQSSIVPTVTSLRKETLSNSSTSVSESSTTTQSAKSTPEPETLTFGNDNATMEESQNLTTSTSAAQSAKSPSTRSDSSESIYAQIIRRLGALEGNSSLVARYIEEQAKVMRLMLGRVERGWDDWRVERDAEELGRWEQERMRQEDRLGKVISQMEQQRLAMDTERKLILSEIRVLAAELGFERRRGIAQLLITLVMIVLGVASRSSTIDAVLRPLMAEARRRKSIYKSISGPLSGLEIDMGTNRPPAVIGQPHVNMRTPVAPGSHARPSRTDSSKRPLTPSRRRIPPGLMQSTSRAFSESTPLQATMATSPYMEGSSPFAFGLKSPKARGSLPPTRVVGAPRKLARSAHIHTIEADRIRRDLKRQATGSDDGQATPRRSATRDEQPRSPANQMLSPLSVEAAMLSDALDVPDDTDERSDWGTEGSVSEVEGDLGTNDKGDEGDAKAIVSELLGIWGDKKTV